MKIVLVTGGFDPLHSGHISYFKEAKSLGDRLIVGLNSDEWLERKKGRAFMPWNERLCIINNLSMVDEVYTFDDEDDSARHFIQQVRSHYPDAELIFANGGDRTKENIPEMDVLDPNLIFVFGIGGSHKKNSSSWILEEWKAPKTERVWGHYKVLHNIDDKVKIKEILVEPGICLSMQMHFYRSEFWFIVDGEASLYTMVDDEPKHLGRFKKFDHMFIERNKWHRLCNESAGDLRIIEIQYGDRCDESDITRL